MITGFWKNLVYEAKKESVWSGMEQYVKLLIPLKNYLCSDLISLSMISQKNDMIYASYNCQSSINDLFQKMTFFLNKTAPRIQLPPVQDFYMIHLSGGYHIIVFLLADYQLNLVIKNGEKHIGNIVHILIPELSIELL